MKRFLTICILTFLWGGSVSAEGDICSPWSEIRIRNTYRLSNNTWNLEYINPRVFHQCLFHNSDTSFGYKWQVEGNELNSVVSYPELIYGKKPWDAFQTGNTLPQQMSDLKSVIVDYKFTVRATGSFNTMLEMWLVTTPETRINTSDHIKFEVLIWFQKDGTLVPAGGPVDEVRLNKTVYQVYLNKHHGKWRYIAFVPKSSRPMEPALFQGSMDLKDYLTYLVGKGLINPSLFLSSIELGNEVVEGRGMMTFERYAIKIVPN